MELLKGDRNSHTCTFTGGPIHCIERTAPLALGFSAVSETEQAIGVMFKTNSKKV